MKTLSDLFPPGGFHDPDDFIGDGGKVDNDMLAYHLLCKLRNMPGMTSYGEQLDLDAAVKNIREYFEATTLAARGKLK